MNLELSFKKCKNSRSLRFNISFFDVEDIFFETMRVESHVDISQFSELSLLST